jgi:gamma-glutamyltranspeptidase / glutathione hydrolase
VNLPYGNAMVIPGTGFLLNNEMDDFSMKAGVPNAFGLVGEDANAIAPGKRPLSS